MAAKPDPASRRVRWGVLGAAAIATARTMPAFAGAPSAMLAALASRDLDRARQAAAPFHVPRVHGSYEALLADPDIDVVYIPLPNNLHYEWCVRALEAGKHVLCEKPLVLASGEVARLREVRDRTSRHIEEAFVYRNHPQWARIGELVRGGAIGPVRAVQGTLAKQFLDPADIRNNPALGGGALYDLGSYVTSACRTVFGREPSRVIAAIDRDPVFGVDRLTTAILDFGDGHASFTVGSQAGPSAWGSHQQLSVLGARGWLRCDFPYAHARPTACHVYVGDETSAGTFATSTIAFDAQNQFALQIERFSRRVRGEDAPSWPIEDAQATLLTIEALFASEQSGRWEAVGAV